MPTGQAANPLIQMFPFIVIFGIFYFLVIKPEKAAQKKKKEELTKLKKNDQIVTTGGIHGTVVNVKPATVIVRVDDNAKIEIDKDAVALIVAKSE